MNVALVRKPLLVAMLFCTTNAKANSDIEVLEILAPKQALANNKSVPAESYVDHRYTFTLNRTIADQLQMIPGVSLNGQGGQFQSYAIRGFSRGRIRTELNGIPIFTDRRAGNSVSFISPELVSSANVIKGPSSAVYGSQALGGVVNLNTKLAEGTSVKLSGQSQNDLVSLAIKNKQDNLSTALAYQEANANESPNGEGLNDQFQRVSALVGYQHIKHGLSTTFSWLPSFGKDIGKSTSKYPDKEVSGYPKEIHSLAQMQIRADEGWQAKVFHHYQNWDSETTRIDEYKSFSAYQSHTLGGQFLLRISPLEQWADNSHVGVDWTSRKGVKITNEFMSLQQSSVLVESTADQPVDGNDNNLAIFTDNNWYLGNAKLNFGLRYDWIKQSSDNETSSASHFSSAVSAQYSISKSFDIAIEFANAFRYPTLSERFYSGYTPRGYIQGNKELNAETSLGSQLSFSWQYQSALTIQGAVYHYTLDNYIERYRIDNDTLTFRNSDSAHIEGIELEVRWLQSQQIEHHVNYQYQQGEDHHNQTLADLHPVKVNWVMLANIDKLTLANSISYQQETDTVASSETKRESFVLWDLSINYQISDKQTLGLAINNISNESYYASLDDHASLQPERQLTLSTNVYF